VTVLVVICGLIIWKLWAFARKAFVSLRVRPAG